MQSGKHFTVQSGPSPFDTNPPLFGDWLVNHPNHWHPIVQQRDQCPKDWLACTHMTIMAFRSIYHELLLRLQRKGPVLLSYAM